MAELERAGRLCAISYRSDAQAIAGYAKLGWAAIALHRSDDIDEAYFLRRGTQAIVVVRGSDEISDWLFRNLMFVRRMRNHIHPGFGRGAYLLCCRIRPLLTDIQSLEIYGHSKGGAIAALLGPMLMRWQPEVVTIGAPRFCAGRYAGKYPAKLTQFVHRHDPIAHMPAKRLGYADCGNIVMVGEVINRAWLSLGLQYHFDYGPDMRWLWHGWRRD